MALAFLLEDFEENFIVPNIKTTIMFLGEILTTTLFKELQLETCQALTSFVLVFQNKFLIS